ncbi:MAG TPA: NAD(P)/FAD-dependent oxidoreductase [Microvirga sp.]|nr:NAD(P)/FAD-dependent oxidoreductase [Microvirga sp.]
MSIRPPFWRKEQPTDRERASDDPHHVVIVGAGFGGLSLAQSLGGTPLRVTVVDRRNFHLFQPLLYQVATAVLSPGEIAGPIRSILNRHGNIEILLGEVDGIDTARREISVGGDRLSYDTLVLATGATHGYFGHPEWARFAPGLKTLEDARRIRAQILLAYERAEIERDPAERERLMTFAIIGGGPTGVEMAGAIADLAHHALTRDFRNIDPRRTRILLVEAAPRILCSFPENLASYTERALGRLGVTLLTGRPVEDVTERGITVGGEFIPAATVVWAAGVAASPAGTWLNVGTDKAGRVPVGPDLSVPGLENVYVIGDLALAKDERGRPLPGLAQVAHQQGKYLGKALRARILSGETPPPFRFRSRGNLAVIGRNEAVVDWDRLKLKGFPAWLVWGIAHVYLLVGFQNRLLVCLRWLWTYLTHQGGSRIIHEDAFGRPARSARNETAIEESQREKARDRAEG